MISDLPPLPCNQNIENSLSPWISPIAGADGADSGGTNPMNLAIHSASRRELVLVPRELCPTWFIGELQGYYRLGYPSTNRVKSVNCTGIVFRGSRFSTWSS